MSSAVYKNLQRYIRIYYECEGGIKKKSFPRIAICNQEACQVMTTSDHEGQIFLFHHHTNNGFFFLVNIEFRVFIFQ